MLTNFEHIGLNVKASTIANRLHSTRTSRSKFISGNSIFVHQINNCLKYSQRYPETILLRTYSCGTRASKSEDSTLIFHLSSEV